MVELPKRTMTSVQLYGRKQNLGISIAQNISVLHSVGRAGCYQFDVPSPFSSPVPQNNEKLQESPCIFALTPRQVELIRNSRYFSLGINSAGKHCCVIPQCSLCGSFCSVQGNTVWGHEQTGHFSCKANSFGGGGRSNFSYLGPDVSLLLL